MAEPGRRSKARARVESGVSLIEVLITLVVFGVGLLSAAALQTISKKANYDALQRTAASHLAYDLMERMRANTSALVNYLPAAELGDGSQGAEPAPNCRSLGAACTAAELAAHDLWQWEQFLDGALETRGGAGTGGLVSPTACIVGPAGGGAGIYTVAMAWRGVTELSNPIINPCGSGSGKYGDDDAYRRVMVVGTFINPL